MNLDSKHFYDSCKTPNGGYGGLLSATFHSIKDATVFYDNLDTEKGPSLGTNFTLASPFVILAHYNELDWVREQYMIPIDPFCCVCHAIEADPFTRLQAAQYGVDAALVRFSVGLEDQTDLLRKFRHALSALDK